MDDLSDSHGSLAEGVREPTDREGAPMSQVYFLLLDHTDEHGSHKHIQKHRIKSTHGHLRMLAADSSSWHKDAMHAITKDQGFTMHTHIGDGPTSGYMVSLNKDTEVTFPVEDITPEDIVAYREKHKSALVDPDNYLGAWVYEGNVYMDISRHITSLEKAMDSAKEHNQLGVFDIVKGETIVTADYFKNKKNRTAVAKVFWKSQSEDLSMINGFRAQAGLGPIVHNTTGAIATRALKLVTRQK